ncbi:MAG TPA: RNA polymerase sigma-70 factor [Chitinophaga sp.]|uniref:RNA polymerase sigma factor n=1 Tax=Chitinophaga sp. TaxID=1869181 RepID=UPI002BC8B6BC|nr:RNA polymerase sigma-70 factor [Chitinophaga sp.]HVI48541.1 RNA polymerase sigma-70 factor [Chitinophaga sp.]
MNNEWSQLADSGSEEAAFTAIYNRYKEAVWQVALMYTKDVNMAQEVVQEVFYRIWANRAGMHKISNIRHYLFIIARNYIFNHFKQAAYEEAKYEGLQLIQETAVNDTDHRLQQHDYHSLLHRAIAALPPKRKQIYLLAKEQEMSYEEIAHTLHISRLTIKNQMAKALGSIRTYVSQHLHISLFTAIISISISFSIYYFPLVKNIFTPDSPHHYSSCLYGCHCAETDIL